MRPPCIIYHYGGLYSLDDGPLVLLGCQQDEVLQAFLEAKDDQIAGLPDGPFWEAAYDPASPHAAVRLTTKQILHEHYLMRNVSAVMRALKRGPLGPAIELPGRERKGRGYLVRIAEKPPDE